MDDKMIFVLNAIASAIFAFLGIATIIEKGLTDWAGPISNLALSVVFGCLAYIFYQKTRKAKGITRKTKKKRK